MISAKKLFRPGRRLIAGGGAVLALAASVAVAAQVAPANAAVASCSATPRIDSQWGSGSSGGQIVTVTVTNTSTVSSSKWAVSWSLATGRRLVSTWNAAATIAGSTVTDVNTAYNGTLAPGASTTFGMQLAGVAPAPAMSCVSDAPAPSPSPSVKPSSRTVTVTTADNQATIALRVGDILVVSLPAIYRTPSVSSTTYPPPPPSSVSSIALTALGITGGYPTGQPLLARYSAIAPGTADVSTMTDYACLHTNPPCALPQQLWTVHVVVS